jgi:transcriptional regulator with XRE-family HTH domain
VRRLCQDPSMLIGMEKGHLLLVGRLAVQDGLGRNLRRQAGLSQAEVAEVVGVTPTTVCRWEGGSRRPTRAAGRRYLELLVALQMREPGSFPGSKGSRENEHEQCSQV